MKKKTVEIKTIKEYLGKRLMSRWKTTTTTWHENNQKFVHVKQDKDNFQSLYFSGGERES